MTSLSPDDFEAYFHEINGYQPFRWQVRLCRYIVDHGEWPAYITAPTGAGKSVVIDVHVFVNALTGWGRELRAPRRLAIVVNRRAIVDSHHDRAVHILQKLDEAEPGSVVAKVRDGLMRLASGKAPNPFILSRLRGGVQASTSDLQPAASWFDDPSACAVICATPDMWGSRLLFQGYGTSRYARPREAGLLARDAVLVLDEAHLNHQLLTTARRCSELQQNDLLGVPKLQVVATTATPGDAPSDRSVGVDLPLDLVDDEQLAGRLQHPKPLTLATTPHWPAGKRPSKAYATFIAEQVVGQVESAHGTTVGCVVNTIDTADEVYGQLQQRYGEGAVLLWIGPLRPLDLKAMRDEHPGAFTVEGDPSIRAVVATQTLEVGVDVDLAALVTELASGTALAQRAGRVNRLGARDQGPCVVVVPETKPTTRHGPYSAGELAQAYHWIHELADRADGIAPGAVAASPPPAADSARAVLSRLEAGEVGTLTTTAEKLIAEIDLARWLRDDLDAEPPVVGIVRRGPLPTNDGAALALLQATPVIAEEIYPTPVNRVRDVIEDVIRQAHTYRRAFCLHDGELRRLDIDDANDRVLPGDTVIVDGDHRIVKRGLIFAHGGDSYAAVSRGDALRILTLEDADEAPTLRRITRALWDDDTVDTNDDAAQSLIVEIVRNLDAELPGSIQVEVPAVPDSASDVIDWAVIRTVAAAVEQTEDTMQIWSGGHVVTLAQHQSAVADRARHMSARIGLPESLQDVLYEAGLHHDDGKAHPEFQRILGADQRSEPLAKSCDAFAELPRRRRRRSGLPMGWRHEQLSAAYAASLFADKDRGERDLITRLVGTSHGRGRAGFAHSAREVQSDFAAELTEVAERLFTMGGWEALIERTERYWGAWECAYLEAILRAADCMISKEGS